MALVECKDCGNPISTEAFVCPKCGRPTGRRPTGLMSWKWRVGLWVVLVLAFLAIWQFLGSPPPKP